jgi:hypothetical protein
VEKLGFQKVRVARARQRIGLVLFVELGDFAGMLGISIKTLPLVACIDGVDLWLQRLHDLCVARGQNPERQQNEVHNEGSEHDGPTPA